MERLIAGALCVLCAMIAAGEDDQANEDETANGSTSTENTSQDEPNMIQTVLDFFQIDGTGYGVGVSYTHDLGREERIKEAVLASDKVRVTHRQDGIIRPMLETHGWWKKPTANNGGWGVFAALQLGGEESISALGGGLMWGLKRKAGQSGFNVGLGLVADPDTQVLGDGIVANEVLPNGETEIRFKKETQYGLVLMFTIGP